MMNILISNSMVTAFIDGAMYSRGDLPKEKLEELQKAVVDYQISPSEEKKKFVISILNFTLTEKIEQKEKVKKEIDDVQENIKKEEAKEDVSGIWKQILEAGLDNLLIEKEKSIFMIGFESVSMPINLVNKMILVKNKEGDLKSFVNFWKLCLLNPNPESRQGLFKYIQKQNLIITNKGYIVSYRRSNKETVKENPMREYVFSEATRIKNMSWHITAYSVADNPEGGYITLDHRTEKYKKFDGEIHGTIKELFQKFQDEKDEIFTDARTGKMKFAPGDIVRQDRSKCDENPNVECSHGLHVGTPKYVAGNSGVGDHLMLVYVNPMHVVSVPYADAYKMRVCEYYFVCTLQSDAEMQKMNDSDLAIWDDEYSDIEISNFENLLKDKKFDKELFFCNEDKIKLQKKRDQLEEDLKKLNKNLSFSDDIVSKDLSMAEIRNIIKSRVQ